MGQKLISTEGIKFTFLGFPTTVNWFFFLLPAFWLSAIDFGRLAPGVSAAGVVAAYVGGMFVGVYGHELGHALAARSIGADAEIDLILFGGLTSWSTGRSITARERLRVSLAGPLVGVAIGAFAWMLSNAMPTVRVELFAFFEVLTQVALVWGIFNLIPFPGFDGGHSLDALLELTIPGSAMRVGAIVKGITSILGIAALWYFFGPLSAIILSVFVFRGGASPLQEFRRSLDAENASVLDRGVELLREGRLEQALDHVERAEEGARSSELRERAQGIRLPVLFWLQRWDELAELPDHLFDPAERGLVLLRAGRLQDAEIALRTAPASGRRSAFLAECLARQQVTMPDDDVFEGAQADLMLGHARSLADRDPEVARAVAEVALELPDLSTTDRMVAMVVARRLDDARMVAGRLGPRALWLVDAIEAVERGEPIDDLLDGQRDASTTASLQGLLHQLGHHDLAVRVGRRALDLGSDDGFVSYNTACAAVRSGQIDLGLQLLADSIGRGVEAQRAIADADFDAVRGSDGFAAALAGSVGSAES